MTTFLAASQAVKLQKIAQPYKNKIRLGKPWNQRSEDDLWRKVLGQVVVIGRAEPGERIQHDPKVKELVSIRRLQRFRTDAELRKYLHGLFVRLGVRYVGGNWRKDGKARAAASNFRKLMEEGSPKRFFSRIANLKSEEERISALQKALKYYGNKGARDTAIELRLAENCMALDARIYGVLKKVGVGVSPDDIFQQIEKELVQKVARPLGISGAVLDRVLFRNYDRILDQE